MVIGVFLSLCWQERNLFTMFVSNFRARFRTLHQRQVRHSSVLHLQQSDQCGLWERLPQHQLWEDFLHLCHAHWMWVTAESQYIQFFNPAITETICKVAAIEYIKPDILYKTNALIQTIHTHSIGKYWILNVLLLPPILTQLWFNGFPLHESPWVGLSLRKPWHTGSSSGLFGRYFAWAASAAMPHRSPVWLLSQL